MLGGSSVQKVERCSFATRPNCMEIFESTESTTHATAIIFSYKCVEYGIVEHSRLPNQTVDSSVRWTTVSEIRFRRHEMKRSKYSSMSEVHIIDMEKGLWKKGVTCACICSYHHSADWHHSRTTVVARFTKSRVIKTLIAKLNARIQGSWSPYPQHDSTLDEFVCVRRKNKIEWD